MQCFQHNETPSIGICKACNKAVCSSCIIDTGNGIACSKQCEKETLEINQIIDRSKKIYSIGDNAASNLIPSSVIVYLFFAILFLGWSAFEYFSKSRVDTFLIVVGTGFLIMSVITYRRAKKMGINC